MNKALSLTLLCVIPCVFYAQEKKIHTENLSYNQSILEGSYSIPAKGTVKGYYDENDIFVWHGEASAIGDYSLSGYGASVSANHSAKINYRDGKLDGKMYIMTSTSVKGMGQSAKISFTCNAMYKDNDPDGVWSIKLNSSANGNTADENYNITFSNHSIAKFQLIRLVNGSIGENDYCYDLSFNEGKVSGRYYKKNEETIIKYGICTNKFKRLTGKITELENDESQIVNDILAKKGEVKPNDYIESGYTLEENSFEYLGDLTKYMNDADYADYPYWSSDHNSSNLKTQLRFSPTSCKYYMLKKIKVDIIDQATAYGIIDDFRGKRNSSGLQEQIDRIKQSNQLLNHYIYKRDKESILGYADSILTVVAEENRIAYEKQKEQERLAEERRKEELRIAEEKRKEELRIAEEKRKEEERLQKEYDNTLSNLNKVDSYIINNLWTKKANSKDFVPVKGLAQEAQTYKTIRKELGLGDILKISTYKDLSNIEKENINKSDTFLHTFQSVIYPGTYIDTINENAAQIAVLSKTECADVGKDYKSYFKGFSFNKLFTSYNELMKYYQTIAKEAERQEECKAFIHARKSINENNVSLKEHCKEYKDITKDYSNYISNVDLSWNKDVSVSKLQRVLDLQNNLKEFIDVRKQITNLDKEILTRGKKAKNIIKLYSSYLSSQDLTWSQDVTKEKLSPIVELQQALLNGLKQSNIEEIDKTVKAKKITTITGVLTLF